MIRPAPWSSILLFTAFFACGGSTSDDTGQTGPAGSGGASGSGGGTAGTGGGASGKGGSSAGSGGSSAGAGGSSAGAGGSSAGAGGSTGGAGGAAGGGVGGAAGQADWLPGSFNLTLPTVKQSKMPFGNLPSPTPGVVMRLDIQKQGASYAAVITPYFGDQATMTVALTPTMLTLGGTVAIKANVQGSNMTDTWTSLSFPRAADGSLSGPAHAIGDEEAFGGDVVDMAMLTGDGQLTTDTTLPEAKLSPESAGGPSGAKLPWDDFVVRMSEGVEPAALTKAIGVAQGGTSLALAKDPTPKGWPGAMRSSVLLTSWDVTDGTLDVTTESGVLIDPSGNTAVKYTASVDVKAVAAAQPAHLFDSDVLSVTPWGVTTFLGGKSGSDPACEMGGCAVLGPLDIGYCAMDEAGLAGRIVADGKSQLSVRFRVFAASQSVSTAPLTVSVTSHEGVVTTAMSMVTLVADSGPFPFSTPWSTLTMPLPAGAKGEVGFVVAASTQPYCGFVPPAVNAKIVVDRVEAL